MCECRCKANKKDVKKLRELERQIKEIREGVRDLTERADPVMGQAALNHLQWAEDNLGWIRVRMSGEVVDA